MADFSVLKRLLHQDWFKGHSFCDNIWPVETEDPTRRRKTLHYIDFETPVLPGPRLLTDPEFSSDLLTAKLYVYYGLSPSDGWSDSAAVMQLDFRCLVTLIRWRLNHGIKRFESLTDAWFREYCSSLQSAGLEGLLCTEKHVDAYLAAVDAGEEELPVYCKGRRTSLAIDRVAQKVGVDNWKSLAAPAYTKVVRAATVRQLHTRASQRARLVTSEEDPQLGLTETRLAALLNVWDKLWKLRGRLQHDQIGVCAFTSELSPYGVAKALAARELGRTASAPPLQTCFLVDQALRWVLDYSDDLKTLAAILDDAHTEAARAPTWDLRTRAIQTALFRFHPRVLGPECPGSPWPILPVYMCRVLDESRRAQGVSIRTAILELLPTACAVVIATFAARRREEIESLRAGCVHVDAMTGDISLETWIEKTLRTLSRIPVPVSVVKAIEVLEWLSERCRMRKRTPWLFEYDELLPSKITQKRDTHFEIKKRLMQFADFVNVPSLLDESRWRFAPHQFRRFFSIVYFNRFRFRSLTALTNFLHHYDPDMTRRYIHEAARGGFARLSEEQRLLAHQRTTRRQAAVAQKTYEDFEAGRKDFMHERFRSVALQGEKIGGYGGEQIKIELVRLVDEAKRLVEIRSTTDDVEMTFDRLLVDFVETRRLEPNGLGHSYCKCTANSQDLRTANCLIQKRLAGEPTEADTAPDPAFAADSVCSPCPHNCQFGENEPYWLERISLEHHQLTTAPSPWLRDLAAMRLEMAMAHHRRCFSAGADGEGQQP